MNSDLLFLASLIVASLLGVPPCCVGKPRQNLGYAYVFRLASRKNSGVIFSQILSCQTITAYLYAGSADSELRTVSNVQNSLGAHEYLGHAKKGYGDKTRDHSKAYELQFNHPSWQKTTSDFKKAHRERYEDYKKRGN